MLRADGTIDTTESEGPLLGIFPDEIFTDCRVKLNPGDRLLIHSDGVEVAYCDSDASTPRSGSPNSPSPPTLPAEQLIQELADRMDANSGSLAPKDDVTMIAIEVS